MSGSEFKQADCAVMFNETRFKKSGSEFNQNGNEFKVAVIKIQ